MKSLAITGLTFALLFGSRGIAQTLAPSQGSVTLKQDSRLTKVAESYKRLNLQNIPVDGYRVQIFFESGANSKSVANAKLAAFEQSHPDIMAYLSYKEPYYRVRVGDFRNIVEAEHFKKSIIDEYPNAYAVKDKITP